MRPRDHVVFILATLRRALRAYDRRVLLRHLEIWQTKAHWIVPASALLCALLGAAVIVPTVEFASSVPAVESLVYPLFFASGVLLLLWLRSQLSTVMSPACPTRVQLLRSMLVRMICIAGLLGPSTLLSVSLRARVQHMMAAEDIVQSFRTLRESRSDCLRLRKATLPEWYFDCTDSDLLSRPGFRQRCEKEMEKAELGKADLLNAVKGVIVFRSSFHAFMYIHPSRGFEDLLERSEWPNVTSPTGEAAARLIVAESPKWVKARCLQPDGMWDPAADALLLYNAQVRRIVSGGYDDFVPKRPTRLAMFMLVCFALLMPFVVRWCEIRRIIVGTALLFGYVFCVQYFETMLWMVWPAERPGLDLVAWSVVVVSALPFVAVPLLRRIGRLESALLSVTVLPVVVPVVPIVVLWFWTPWYWGSNEGGVVSVVIAGFAYRPEASLTAMEPIVYAAGLGYACAFVVLLGPSVHRIAAAPK